MPALRCSIHEKISGCDADDWDDVVRASRSDILMSHEFVAAVEEAFDDQARFAHAVVYDDGRAVACGSLSAFPIDINLLADGPARRITEIIRKPMPSMMRKTVVFCGLPVSVGTRQVAISRGPGIRTSCERSTSTPLRWLDAEGAPTSFSRSFGPRLRGDGLSQELGYRRFSSPAMNTSTAGSLTSSHNRRPPEPVSAVRAQVAGQIARRRPTVRTAHRHRRDRATV